MFKITATFLLAIVSFLSYAQTTSNRNERLQPLLQDIVAKAKEHSLYKSNVDWSALEAEVLLKEDTLISDAEFTRKVKRIFQALGDKHGGLRFQGKVIRQGDDASIQVSPALKDPFRGKPVEIRTSMLENGYGYILVPGTNKHDGRANQQYQDSLCSLDLENLKGLVIDLRLNEGGSIYPLFTGFNQLFGNKTIGYTCNGKGKRISRLSVENGSYYYAKHRVASVFNRCRANKELRIVVLTSPITASAGEMLAIAFKGRDRTLFIGEKTAGYITMVSEFNLGEGYLGLSSSFMADRNGAVYDKHVLPDVEIVEGDNFLNLHEDAKVRAALQWLKGE